MQNQNPYLTDPDVVLMLDFKAGNKSAFEQLMVKYYPRILNFIYRYISQSESVEDLTQEVFIKIYHSASSYEPKSKFQTWVYTIAKNVSLNELRKKPLARFSLDEKVLGFANRWYRSGYDAAFMSSVAKGLSLWHLSAPYFLATKFEAFEDRGQNDVYLSHDLEDIMTVIEGRASVVADVAATSADVQTYIGASVAALLTHDSFHNALPGLLSDPQRVQVALARLNQISRLQNP